MDILFFIGQALAIAAIGYVIAQAFAYSDKDDDVVTPKSADSRTPPAASEDARRDQTTLRLSFIPESTCTPEHLTDHASERADTPQGRVIGRRPNTVMSGDGRSLIRAA